MEVGTPVEVTLAGKVAERDEGRVLVELEVPGFAGQTLTMDLLRELVRVRSGYRVIERFNLPDGHGGQTSIRIAVAPSAVDCVMEQFCGYDCLNGERWEVVPPGGSTAQKVRDLKFKEWVKWKKEG